MNAMIIAALCGFILGIPLLALSAKMSRQTLLRLELAGAWLFFAPLLLAGITLFFLRYTPLYALLLVQILVGSIALMQGDKERLGRAIRGRAAALVIFGIILSEGLTAYSAAGKGGDLIRNLGFVIADERALPHDPGLGTEAPAAAQYAIGSGYTKNADHPGMIAPAKAGTPDTSAPTQSGFYLAAMPGIEPTDKEGVGIGSLRQIRQTGQTTRDSLPDSVPLDDAAWTRTAPRTGTNLPHVSADVAEEGVPLWHEQSVTPAAMKAPISLPSADIMGNMKTIELSRMPAPKELMNDLRTMEPGRMPAAK